MTALVVLLAAAVVSAPESIDALQKELASRRAHIGVVEARFTHEHVTPDDVLRSTGSVLYVRPRRVIFRWEMPDEMTYVADGTELYEYDPLLEQLRILDLAGDPEAEALFFGFEDDLSRLRKAYDLELIKPGDVPGASVGLQLRPKPREDDAEDAPPPLFEWVKLYLRSKDLLPCRVEILNNTDSHVVMCFADVRAKATIDDPKRTELHVPAGTTVVHDEERSETVGEGGKIVLKALDPWIPKTPPAATEDSAANQ